jgi:hypothetical protein
MKNALTATRQDTRLPISPDKDNDEKSVSTKSSKSSKTSKASKAKSINKTHKRLKKSFAALSSKIKELENEDSDISESESGDDEASPFQTGTLTGFQMVQVKEGSILNQTFEQRNVDVLFKKNHGSKIHLNLQNVMLLDSQGLQWIYSVTQS